MVEGFFADEGAVDAAEEVDVGSHLGGGFAAAKLIEDVVLDDGENTGEGGDGCGLAADAKGAAELFHEPGLFVERVPGGVEPAKGGGTGVEGQAFGARFGQDFSDLVVGVVFAEVDDALLVLWGELFELAGFHVSSFWRAGGEQNNQ